MCNLESANGGIEYKIFPVANRYANKIDYVIPIGGANYDTYKRDWRQR